MTPLPSRLLVHRHVTETGCWEWTGARNKQGYGRVTWQGETVGVHRLVGHLVHGMDLRGRHQAARHRCDNPPCFNPQHLLPGSYSDNVRDAIERGRARGFGVPQEACPKGHELSGGNVKPDYRGRRRCRECDLQNQRDYYRRRKQEQGSYWSGSHSTRVACPGCGKELRRDTLARHRRESCRRALDGSR